MSPCHPDAHDDDQSDHEQETGDDEQAIEDVPEHQGTIPSARPAARQSEQRTIAQSSYETVGLRPQYAFSASNFL